MRRRALRRGDRGSGTAGTPAWMTSWANVATVLMAFFVMLYALSGVGGAAPRHSAGVTAPAAAAKPVRQATLSSLKSQISAELAARHAESLVRLDEGAGALIIHLNASALFDSGQAEIKPQAVLALDAVGAVLAGVSNQILIEGHTDSDRMIPKPEIPDNWALSGARAAGVLRYLHEFHRIAYDRMSFAGYADTRPVAGNDTPEGKARNRRVDIVVLGR